MSQGPFVGRNGVLANNSLTVANTSQVFIVANSSGIFVGANVDVTNDKLLIGNSTVNVTVNSSLMNFSGAVNVTSNTIVVGTSVINASAISLGSGIVTIDSAVGMTIGNSSVNAFANSTIFKIGIITSNTSGIGIGSNVIVDSSHVFVGNATSNSIATQNGWSISDASGTMQANSTVIQAGTNTFLSASGLLIGNSTVNTSISATGISVNGNPLLPAIIDLGIVIGDGTNVITTGQAGRVLGPFDFSGQIVGWSIIGQESGTVSIDVRKCTYSQYDAGVTHPASGDIISASAPITMTASSKNQSSTLTGWTTTFSVNDILSFNVTSASASKQVLIFLKVKKLS